MDSGRRPGSLSWWVAAPAGLYVALCVVFQYRRFHGNELWVSGIAGMMAGGFLVSGLLAGLAWLASRRSRLATSVAFTIGLLMASGAYWRMFTRDQAQREARQRYGKEIEEQIARNDAALRPGGTPEEAARALEALRAKTADTPAGMPESERRAAAVVAEVLGDFQGAVTGKMQAMQAIAKAGGLNPATLTSEADAQGRQLAINVALAANRKLRDTLVAQDARIRERLVEAGASQTEAEATLERFNRGFRPQLQIQGCEATGRVLEHGHALLELLRTQWGHWRWDPPRNAPVFENAEAVTQFNRLSALLNQAIRDEQRLAQEMMTRPPGL